MSRLRNASRIASPPSWVFFNALPPAVLDLVDRKAWLSGPRIAIKVFNLQCRDLSLEFSSQVGARGLRQPARLDADEAERDRLFHSPVVGLEQHAKRMADVALEHLVIIGVE